MISPRISPPEIHNIGPWYYLVKFEGFSEEEAKALEEEAQPKEPDLFGAGDEE